MTVSQFPMKPRSLIALFLAVSLNCVYGQSLEDSLLAISRKQKNSKDWKAYGQTAYRLGKYYYREYEDSLCAVYLKSSAQAASKANDLRTQAAAVNMYGNLISVLGDHEGAVEQYKKAVFLADSMQNDTLKASFLNNYGLELKSLGDYEKSVEVLYRALETKERIGATEKSISSTLLNIGLVWDILEKPEDALDYYQRSLKLKRKLKDSLGISRLLSNISVILKNQEKYNEAIRLIEESNSFNAGEEDYMQYYINHTNLGNIYKHLENEELSLAHYESAYFYAQELKDPEGLCDIHQNLGSYYFEAGDLDKALFHFDLALKIPGEQMTAVLMYEVNSNLAEVYAAKGMHEKAYKHLLGANVYRDSIFKMEGQLAIEDVREKYETEKKEKELALQKLMLANADVEARKKSMIIVALIAGIVILGLIGFIVFRQYRERQRKKLVQSEQRLEKYREELEVLRLGIQEHLNEKSTKFNVQITREDINQYLIDPLTDREREILVQITAGKTNKEIAASTFISENTVKYHLKNIYLKLDVKNRTEAITKADALRIWDQA